MSTSEELDLKAQNLREQTEAHLMEIAEFVQTEEFQDFLEELWYTPSEERPQFVRDTILDEEEREQRGIEVPEGMAIQRSAFADQRPTLFCVTKWLNNMEVKVTVTFDNVEQELG